MSLAGSHLYAVGEMYHNVVAFDLTDISQPLNPIPNFSVNIYPPDSSFIYQRLVDSAEIYFQTIPNPFYLSNRWELRIQEKQPHVEALPEKQMGGAIAIILLCEDGIVVDGAKHIRTGLDVIRGLQITPDGKYAAVGGQEGGGIEYTRGKEWPGKSRNWSKG